MNYKLNFYKKNGNWYADVPNHTEDENEMVLGSDVFLEIFSQDGEHCSIVFQTEYNDNLHYIAHLKMREHDWDGAWYDIEWDERPMTLEGLWICNVTHDVCGEHPNNIYITNIE